MSRPMSFSGGLYNPGRNMIPFDSRNKPSHSFQTAGKKKKSLVKKENNEFYSEVRKSSEVVESKEDGADKFIKGEVS